MKLNPGDFIPENKIIRSFCDTNNGNMLIEVEYFPGILLRIDNDNRFLFKVDKACYSPGTLKLLFEKEQSKKDSFIELPDYLKPYLKKAFVLQDNNGIHIYDHHYRLIGHLPPKENKFEAENIQSFFEFSAPSPEVESDVISKKNIPDEASVNSLTSKQKDEALIRQTMENFESAINTHNIQADYFINEKLDKKNTKNLVQVYKGNLVKLNVEIQLGWDSRDKDKISSGFDLLKASLIHELYINSTIKGRYLDEDSNPGKNMIGLLTFMVLLKEDGSLRKFQTMLSVSEQKSMIKILQQKIKQYPDKSDIIFRVYQKVMFDYQKDLYPFGNHEIGFEQFKGILIYKLYENTNRLDRGDGITMICITRDIMEYKLEK